MAVTKNKTIIAMENQNQEKTGMALLKTLQSREKRGEGMTSEEREWFKYAKKLSKKLAAKATGAGTNPDKMYGSFSD